MQYKSIEEIIDDLEKKPIESGGNIYHPIPFREFEHLKTSSNKAATYKKWDIIEKTLIEFVSNDFHRLKLLDIGANGGFYTFNLARKGAKVVSFEPHPRYAPIGKFLAREKQLDVEWHDSSFDSRIIQKQNFDVVLLLSTFQWMARDGEKMTEACKELKDISSACDYMIFELGYNKGKSCIKTRKLNHYAELIRFLKKHTNYRHFKFLGTTKLWKASRRYLVICSNDRRIGDSLFWRFVRIINI